jgi:serine/threonine protein kinase
VYLADDSRLHRKVALKYLFSPSGPEATLRASLLREAEAVARITHPHVAIVYDIIEQPSVDRAKPAICRHFKTGHFEWAGSRPSEFYRTMSPDCKSVWTFVRQLRGPHFSTCA